MTSKSQVISQQLKLIGVLVFSVVLLLLVTNLTYLITSKLEYVDSRVALHKTEIAALIETCIKSEKDKSATILIKSDNNLQATLQTALNQLEVAKYIAITDENNKPLAVAATNQVAELDFSEPDIKNLRDSNIFIQALVLLWGQNSYQYSFPITLGRDEEGQNYGVKIRFAILTSNIRMLFLDALLVNLILFLTSIVVATIIALKSADLVGAKLSDRLGSSHPLIDLVDRVDQSHTSVENLVIVKHIGEQARQILASAQYIEDRSGPIGILISLRDFDSFRQFQSQLDYSDKLAALGRITSGVAHEVKNPLNAMVIHLEILRAKLDQPGTDITPQLDILSSEIKRLDRVVQTFLNFTRPVKVNLVPIDLNDLVHQVTRLAAAEAAASQVDILEELSPEFLRVNGDADLLKQTLLNIIINGCQAMPKGGPLSVKTRRTGNYAVVTISDRGVGIPLELQHKIFQLYYTTKPKGNGIGLANAFRTIQLHNGRVEFESTTDVGTKFKIYLPEV